MKGFLDGQVHAHCDLKVFVVSFLFNETSWCDDLIGKPNVKFQNGPSSMENYVKIIPTKTLIKRQCIRECITT